MTLAALTDRSVWYQFKAPKRGAIVLDLDAAGEMDAVIDLYRQVRSRFDEVNCRTHRFIGDRDPGRRRPEARGRLRDPGGRLSGSIADSFTLRVPDPRPGMSPGKPRCPPKGPGAPSTVWSTPVMRIGPGCGPVRQCG